MAKKAATLELDPQHVANVVDCVSRSTAAQRQAGLLWYRVYGRAVARIATAHHYTPEQGWAAFAVLSQRTKIDRHVENYKLACANGHTDACTFVCTDQRRKVQAILADRRNPAQHATGPKVSAFYANLAGDYDRVTVDRHAVSMVFGIMREDVGSDYAYSAAVIATAAAMLDLTPAQCQAIGWVVWRSEKGIKDDGGLALVS